MSLRRGRDDADDIRFEERQERLAEERAERRDDRRAETATIRGQAWQEAVTYGENQ